MHRNEEQWGFGVYEQLGDWLGFGRPWIRIPALRREEKERRAKGRESSGEILLRLGKELEAMHHPLLEVDSIFLSLHLSSLHQVGDAAWETEVSARDQNSYYLI